MTIVRPQEKRIQMSGLMNELYDKLFARLTTESFENDKLSRNVTSRFKESFRIRHPKVDI